jgi:hypothetical protein
MLKRIPKSDISIRPFKAYKEWSFNQDSTEIDVLQANVSSSNINVFNNGSGSVSYKSVYGQLKSQFYGGNENNPFTRVGAASLSYNNSDLTKDRFLSGSAKVISIPQSKVGEGIKKGTVRFSDGDKTYGDDGYGNIVSLTGDVLSVGYMGIPTTSPGPELGYLYFVDIANTVYTSSIIEYDIQSGLIDLEYEGTRYNDLQIFTFNLVDESNPNNTGTMVVDNVPFLSEAGGTNRIGNVFYNQGIVTITRSSQNYLTGSWELNYKSTQTIYENEYLLIVNEDEFNVSQNPSAISIVNEEKETFETTNNKTLSIVSNPGVKYIKKLTTLENGNQLDYRYTSSVNSQVLAGFEHWDFSGSVDSTGSFLAPFITTIGLYDDNCELVAVAKLPQPIKSDPDIPVNFIIRFDT